MNAERTFCLEPFPCPSCGQGVLVDALNTSSEPWKVGRVLRCEDDLRNVRANRHEELNVRLIASLYDLRRFVEHSVMLRVTGVRPWLLEAIDKIIEENG